MNQKLILTIGIILISFIVLKNSVKGSKSKKGMNAKNFTDIDFQNAIQSLKNEGYKYEALAIAEKMFRLETNHFKSNQYRKTGTGGMESKGGQILEFPYGWSSLANFYDSTGIKPLGLLPFVDNHTKKTRQFVVFDSVKDAIKFMMFFILTVRNGQYKYWNSLDETTANNYKKVVDSIKPVYTNLIFNR